MYIDTLLEILSAVHLSHFVEGPFKERGGLMLVAPPSSLKSALTEVMNMYSASCVISDINQKTLIGLHKDISANKITTLTFLDFEKIYQRHQAVSVNVEGTLKGMVAEGFHLASFEDSRMVSFPARASVIAGMTRNFYLRKYPRWLDDGFARRFIWSHYRLKHPDIIADAISDWKRLPLSPYGFSSKIPPEKTIPYCIDKEEDAIIRMMLKDQPSTEIGYILLKKIYCALVWKFNGDCDTAMDFLADFAPSLQGEGTELEIRLSCPVDPPQPITPKRSTHNGKPAKTTTSTVPTPINAAAEHTTATATRRQ